MEEYVQEFETPLIKRIATEPPEQTIASFVAGLKYEISCIVDL